MPGSTTGEDVTGAYANRDRCLRRHRTDALGNAPD